MIARCLAPILLVLASCSGTHGRALGEASLELAEPVRVELHPDDRPVVDVRLDGLPPKRFVVDTGAQMSFVSLACAQELGLEAKPYATSFRTRGSTGHERELRDYVHLQTFAIAALVVRDCRLTILDDPALASARVDGILGQDVLGRVTAGFDMAGRAVHFLPVTGDDAVRAWLTKEKVSSGTWVVADLVYDPLPTVYVPIPGLEGATALGLDTGAQGTSFAKPALAAMEAVRTGSSPHEGVGGSREVAKYRVDHFDLYGVVFALEADESEFESGLLGMNVLGRLVFVVDGPARRLWLHHR